MLSRTQPQRFNGIEKYLPDNQSIVWRALFSRYRTDDKPKIKEFECKIFAGKEESVMCDKYTPLDVPGKFAMEEAFTLHHGGLNFRIRMQYVSDIPLRFLHGKLEVAPNKAISVVAIGDHDLYDLIKEHPNQNDDMKKYLQWFHPGKPDVVKSRSGTVMKP